MAMNTFACARKRAWLTLRREEVGKEYAARNMSHEEIFLDFFHEKDLGMCLINQ